jgi:hypothetical protein
MIKLINDLHMSEWPYYVKFGPSKLVEGLSIMKSLVILTTKS